ncbi:MAG: flagellar basal body protein FliL [Paracoccaceae bacterium]|nr:MAG: flagellar basal body protein FliL [Alphaproteobacteria bacterium]GIX15507.1 MAG: flagellar basal body protein FliL [Paracoccaceae bacterium]
MAEEVAEAAADAADAPARKRGGKGPILGLIAALLLGAGGFFATYTGLLALPVGNVAPAHRQAPRPDPLGPVSFMPLGDVVISLGARARARHLEMAAELEVAPDHESEVILLKPRILDVVNTYLRAVELSDLEDPAALPRIRGQLLRRIQIVTGEGRVRDLLITRFVLS